MPATHSSIALSDTGYFSELFLNYLSRKPELQEFYNYYPDEAGFEAALKDIKQYAFQREVLVRQLTARYQDIAIHPRVNEQIKRLQEPNTFTITTGHQLCLFTGPLYFIYKIVTTINLCERLNKQYPHHHFVPVYWMASEDHDFAEVNHAYVSGQKISWDLPLENSGAVGRLELDDPQNWFKQLDELLHHFPHYPEIKAILENSYLPGETLSQATMRFVNALFGSKGLVIVEADDAELKRLANAYFLKDAQEQHAFNYVNQTNELLLKQGYKTQVNPREINLFYLDKHRRERLLYHNKRYEVNHTDLSFSDEELTAHMQKHPERFSPNVVLRPVYQQLVLPNLAYIGGPGELAYWLQFKKVFDTFGVFYPVLAPRNFVMLADETTTTRMEKIGFSPIDLFKPLHELIAKLINQNSTHDLNIEPFTKQLKGIYEHIIEQVKEVDPTLKAPAEAEWQKALKGLEQLQGKVKRAEKQKHETAIQQLTKAKGKLFPQDELQERHDNALPWIAKYGVAHFLDQLSPLDPLDFRFQVMQM